MLQFYLAATQFALGDLPAPTTPSAKLTPAIRAQERLGWRLCLLPARQSLFTLFEKVNETIDRAAELGLLYIGAGSLQMADASTREFFDDQLKSEEQKQIRLKLDEAGIRLLTYRIGPGPADENRCRSLIEFAHRMGVEAVAAEPSPDMSGVVKRLCDAYDIRFTGATLAGQGIVRLSDLNDERVIATLEEVGRTNAAPVLFTLELPLEPPGARTGSASSLARTVELFNKMSLQLAERRKV